MDAGFTIHGITDDGGTVTAGSDIANGWGGFIDGAIESGMEAAGEAATLLSGRPARQQPARESALR